MLAIFDCSHFPFFCKKLYKLSNSKIIMAITKETNPRFLTNEDYELADDLVKELEESRSTPRSKYISQEEMDKEFGHDNS